MSKCVICAAINAENESIVHTNWQTIATAKALARRAKRTLHTDYTKFCTIHNKDQREDGTFLASADDRLSLPLQARAHEVENARERKRQELAKAVTSASESGASLAQIVRTLVS